MEKRYKHDPNLVVEPAFYSNGIPVFKPTMDQFRDFYKFNKAVNSYGMKSGIIKIIPPSEWLSQLQSVYTAKNFENVVIRNPIVQNVNSTAGYKGVYSSQNVERQRKYSLSQWLELSKKPNYQPPAPKKRRDSAEKELQESKTPNTRAKEHVHRSKRPNKECTMGSLHSKLNIDISEFTEERCNELENLYWRSLGYAEPMYGADVLGSLFQDSIKSWNVAHLPNLLDLMDEKVPGVNDAYLYAGLWKATFSWHLEDQDLYSINYLHLGAPKQWYSISQKDSSKFYDLMKDIFNEDYKNCSEFLRHKTFLASPAFLEKNGINCNKIVHNQGEFIITYPYGYHAGFNYGYNLAESVNFALDEWFEFAAKTKKCECIQDSVGINSRQIFCKFKGIPYDESGLIMKEDSRCDSNTAEQTPIKRRRKTTVYNQCVLCPMELPDKLLEFREFELLSCDATDPKTNTSLQVHRICSEAFSQYLHLEPKEDTAYVTGIKDIPRSHRSLKCLHCRLPNKYSATGLSQGACFQCSAGTCTKSYHPICALSSGFLFNNQTCKVHRRSSSKFFERQNDEYLKVVSSLKQNSLVQFSENPSGRRHTGDVWCGLIQSNNGEKQTLDVLVLPSLEQLMTVSYDDVLLGDSSDTDNKKFWDMAASTVRPFTKSPVPEAQDEKKSSTRSSSTKFLSVPCKKSQSRKELSSDNTENMTDISKIEKTAEKMTEIMPEIMKPENVPTENFMRENVPTQNLNENIQPQNFMNENIQPQEFPTFLKNDFKSNMISVTMPQQFPMPSGPFQPNIANGMEYAMHPRQINQFVPAVSAVPLVSAFDGYNYTFQHPRSFSDSSSWLLPMNRQAGAAFINGYSGRTISSNSEVNQIQFFPQNF